MMKLPSTVVEARAGMFAREKLDWYREHKFLDSTNPDLARQWMKHWCAVADVKDAMFIVRCARDGWQLAEGVLRELILEYDNNYTQKPAYLHAYSMDLTAGFKPKRTPGKNKYDNFFRDVAIASLVLELTEKFQLHPTGGKRLNGCALVAVAMNLDYESIKTVWLQYGKEKLRIFRTLPW